MRGAACRCLPLLPKPSELIATRLGVWFKLLDYVFEPSF